MIVVSCYNVPGNLQFFLMIDIFERFIKALVMGVALDPTLVKVVSDADNEIDTSELIRYSDHPGGASYLRGVGHFML